MPKRKELFPRRLTTYYMDVVGLIIQIGVLSGIRWVNVGFGQLTRICLDNMQIGGINPINSVYFQADQNRSVSVSRLHAW